MVTNVSADIIQGYINRIYQPSERPGGKWSPGKVIVETEENGPVDVSFWPRSDFDEVTRVGVTRIPLEMGAEWAKLDVDRDEGATITLIAEFSGEYQGRNQYRKASIKSLSTASQAATPAPAGGPAPVAAGAYAPASRSEQGMALGNAKGVGGNIISAYVQAMSGALPGDEWLVAAANAVNVFSAALLAPAIEPDVEPVEAPAPTDDDFDFGTLSEEN